MLAHPPDDQGGWRRPERLTLGKPRPAARRRATDPLSYRSERGMLRARMDVHAIAAHSGSSRAGAGAVAKAADLIRELRDMALPRPADPRFPLPARLLSPRSARRRVLRGPGPVPPQHRCPADPGTAPAACMFDLIGSHKRRWFLARSITDHADSQVWTDSGDLMGIVTVVG
jgi:hypothetical protein